MNELERFTEAMAKMMGYCKYAPLNEYDDCLFHDEYICETNKLCSKVGWSLITPEGELTPECRRWWEKELPEAWEKYLFHTEYLENSFDRKSKTEVLNAQLDWRNLWGWMRENVDSWLYEKCPKCHGTEFSNVEHVGRFICDLCNGTGRVARWDVEKWLEGKAKEVDIAKEI